MILFDNDNKYLRLDNNIQTIYFELKFNSINEKVMYLHFIDNQCLLCYLDILHLKCVGDQQLEP